MKRNNKDVSCPYCGSKNVVAGDADWFRKSKDTLVYFYLLHLLFAQK